MVWFTTPRPIASAALSHFKLTTNRCKESKENEFRSQAF